MTLERNQIENLYIWVHPGNRRVPKQVYDEWAETIAVLSANPEFALIETSNAPSHVFYRIAARRDHRKRAYLSMVGVLEEKAEQELGERFALWPHGSFIDGSDYQHATELKELLNITERQIGDFSPRNVLFDYIFCFGLEPSGCVEWQACSSSLGRIAHNVESHGYSSLGALGPKTG